MKCWSILKKMILESGATNLLEFKMHFNEETMSFLVSCYGKGVFDLVTVSFLAAAQNTPLKLFFCIHTKIYIINNIIFFYSACHGIIGI